MGNTGRGSGDRYRSPRIPTPLSCFSPQVAARLSENHVANCLVISHITRTPAEVPIQGFANGFFELNTSNGRFLQAFQRYLAFVQKAGRAVATLKCEVFDERCLQNSPFSVLGVALNRPNFLAVEIRCRNNASRIRITRAVRAIDNDYAA
jgi:hypothetical protein